MPPRIPQPEDFTALRPAINVALTYPEVPETTTAILLLFHGLGDSETPFTTFATSVALPGVLGISVRGVSPLPPALLGLSDDELASPSRHFHWGDDLTIDSATGGLDPDPGFTKAKELVFDKLIKETLVNKCGWDFTDILLFGYGQGEQHEDFCSFLYSLLCGGLHGRVVRPSIARHSWRRAMGSS